MSWNRSDTSNQRGAGCGRRSVPFVLFVASVPLALLCGVAVWLMVGRGGSATPAPRPKTPRSGAIGIDLRTSAKAAKAAERARGPRSGAHAARPAGPTNRVELTKNVKPPTVLGCNYYECVSGGRPLFTKPIFTNSAENIIGGLLSAKPGERFVPVELGEDFDKDFADSLNAPIVIGEDDTHADVILKEAVSKAKGQIAAGMESGQRPSEVITAMRDEMNRIADYRDLLQEDFDKLKETGSAEKIMAYLKEANMLLDEFGADHLDLPEDEIKEINRRLSGDDNDQKENKE